MRYIPEVVGGEDIFLEGWKGLREDLRIDDILDFIWRERILALCFSCLNNGSDVLRAMDV